MDMLHKKGGTLVELLYQMYIYSISLCGSDLGEMYRSVDSIQNL